MSFRTLLINASHEVIGFISLRKLMRLLVKNKIEIIAEWDEDILTWGSGSMKTPATVKLKYYVPHFPRRPKFNRRALFKRDNFMCQYCGLAFSQNELTIDHVLPRSRGGLTSWINCAAACLNCNHKKFNRTPEEAKMYLLNKPIIPTKSMLYLEYNFEKNKHETWGCYFA